MIGSPDFSQPPAVEYFFLNCIPYKARCALSFFPVLHHCDGRGKQTWGSVVTKGKKLASRVDFFAFFILGSCGSLNRH